nr:hypothetical protein BaRGS_026845 [Batillaria attramentaria]
MHPFSHHAGFLADHSPAVQSQLNLNCCPQIGKLPQNYELALGNDLKMQERVASGLVENPMASSGHAASSSRALPRQRTASQQGGEDVRKTFGSARPHHPGVVLDGVEDIRKSFRCPQCRYLTDRKNNLKRHIVTMHHTSTRVLECCGALFSSKASLRDHVTLFHRGGYRCQVCGRNFCRKALLRRHLTVHSGQKDFACHLCGYATSHKSNLERHQRVHARKSDVIAPEPILPEYEFQYVEEQRQRNIFRAERENSDQAQQFNQKPLKKPGNYGTCGAARVIIHISELSRSH